MKHGQSVVPYALNSRKKFTHSTIKVPHQPTSSECVTTFPCSLPRACQNDMEGKLQKFAMVKLAKICCLSKMSTSIAYMLVTFSMPYLFILILNWKYIIIIIPKSTPPSFSFCCISLRIPLITLHYE